MSAENNAKPDASGYTRKINAQMMGKLMLIAVMMFGFGYALVPIYKKICEITGIYNLTQKDDTVKGVGNTQVDKTRLITIEFDANSQGPWRFRPKVNSMQVHPGELKQIEYEVVNKLARSVDAQAIPSYAPQQSEQYFKKVECFCFKQQKLGPNEAKQMPVVFYIDPSLPKSITTITLSYTFFEIAGQVKKES